MEMFVVDATCRAFHKTVPFIKWLIIWSRTDKQLESYSHCNRKPCNCHFDTEHLIRISFFLFFISSWQLCRLTPWHRWICSVRDSWNHCWWRRTPQPSHSNRKVTMMKMNKCIRMMIEAILKHTEKTIVNKLKSIDDWHF